jgi:hypothetical protein
MNVFDRHQHNAITLEAITLKHICFVRKSSSEKIGKFRVLATAFGNAVANASDLKFFVVKLENDTVLT